MKKIFITALLLLGFTSTNVLANDKARQLMATCPTVAEISSTNPLPPWNLDDIQGKAPYHFIGAEIEYIKDGNTEEAVVTCKYFDSNKVLNRALTQFSSPIVEPYSCSFIINEPHAKTCPYVDPAKCSVYCSS